jgi:hypothetical protein
MARRTHNTANTKEAPGFVNYKKGELDSQPQVIKFTSCLSMVLSGYSASSTTKTGRHDIAESGVKTPKIKSNQPKKQNLSVCVCIKSHNYFPSLFFFILSGFNSFVY